MNVLELIMIFLSEVAHQDQTMNAAKAYEEWLHYVKGHYVGVVAIVGPDGSRIGPTSAGIIEKELFGLEVTIKLERVNIRDISLLLLEKLELREDAWTLYPKILAKLNAFAAWDGHGSYSDYTDLIADETRKRYGLKPIIRPQREQSTWPEFEKMFEFDSGK